MTTIYMIRHAEAEGNLYRIVQLYNAARPQADSLPRGEIQGRAA